MEPNKNTELSNKIQALLFAEGDSISFKKLAQLTECDATLIPAALDSLAELLKGSALILVRSDTEAALAVAPENIPALEAARIKEGERDIGDAGLEVLAILLYEDASTRAEIDYIRGVNSSSTLRTLLSRRMVERTGNPEDAREYVYRPTVELLAHLGVSNASELPEYATIAPELSAFKSKNEVFSNTDNGPR